MPDHNMAELKASAYTLILLFKSALGSDPDLKLLKTLATVQCQGLSVCASAGGSMRKLSDLGSDAQARLANDPQLALLLTIQQTKQKRKTYQKELSDVRQSISKSSEQVTALFRGDETHLAAMQGLLDLDIGRAFDEHRSEGLDFETMFQDCLKVHAASLCRKLQSCAEDSVSVCQGWQQGGPHFWRDQAGAAASVQDLQQLLKRSILALNPKDLKRVTDDFIKVGGSRLQIPDQTRSECEGSFLGRLQFVWFET